MSKLQTNSNRIFLSHASIDGGLAKLISSEIEYELEDKYQVFASTRPDAIPSGADWLETVLNELEIADALIILITETSANSVWVGFELGYFWKKKDRENIYALYHPNASIPNPLDTLQAKRITSIEELSNFFKRLCADMGETYTGRANIEAIVRAGNSITGQPATRSLAQFEKYLAPENWEKVVEGAIDTWICIKDALYQIAIEDSAESDFDEEWLENFPAQILGYDKARKYVVRLKIAGNTVKRLYFITLDSARYFVPLPEIDFSIPVEEPRKFYWDRNSLIFKTAKIIGQFYHMYPSLEDFAEQANIEIR